VKMLILRQC